MSGILALLDNAGVSYKRYGEHHHVSSGEWVQVDCPLCSPGSRRFRLGLNLVRRFANCWKCGGVGFLWALGELTGSSKRELLHKLEVEFLPPLRKLETSGKVTVPTGVRELSPLHRRYLKDRGFDPNEIVRLWGVKGIGIAPRLSWSLWIPIHFEGRMVSWTTRKLVNRGSKYVNAKKSEESLPAKHLLYGEDYCRMSVIVAEGPTDVWAIGPGAVATMGVVVTEEQLYRISKYPLRVIAFDNEEDAQRRAMELAKRLKVYPGETEVVRLESGKDWAEADQQEIQELRALTGENFRVF